MNTKGRYGDGVKVQGFQTFESLRDLGIGTVLRHRPGGHGFQEIDLACLVNEASVRSAYRAGKTAGPRLDWPAGVFTFRGRGRRCPEESVNRQRRGHRT